MAENFKEIDVEGLAISLAEMGWKEATESVETVDLYQQIVDINGTITKEIHPYWAAHFFLLKDKYTLIIEQYQRNGIQ